jgi:hypothetical protein
VDLYIHYPLHNVFKAYCLVKQRDNFIFYLTGLVNSRREICYYIQAFICGPKKQWNYELCSVIFKHSQFRREDYENNGKTHEENDFPISVLYLPADFHRIVFDSNNLYAKRNL